MIDIHSHFLPGIDDGAKDRSQSIKMLEQAVEAGITEIVSTPHFNEFISSDYIDKIDKVFNETNEIILKNNLEIKIHSASEVLLDSKFIDWANHKNFLHGRKNNYLLFELPHFFEFPKISDIIFKLKLQHITPILAHPERSLKIQENPDSLIQWIQQGCIMQMNAGSILGQFGKRCKSISKRLLDSGVIHLIASDAHEPKHRNYLTLIDAKEYIIQNYDEEFGEILFNKNPANILNSKSVKFFKIKSENLKNNKLKYIINKFRLSS
jgi:protein-tyrosine phosphatase